MVKTQQRKKIIIVKRDKKDCKIDILKEKEMNREEGDFLNDTNPQEYVNIKSKNNNNKKAFIHEYNIAFFKK